ncbi:MAG: hypothetical protein GC181_09785 [Bacteroidetes bacterium]|nr:hypothetical protein [Bacteroidota bacterium]
MPVTQVYFHGEKVNVYPARLPRFNWNGKQYIKDYKYNYPGSSRYATMIDQELKLSFNPFSVPDGKYVIYYQKFREYIGYHIGSKSEYLYDTLTVAILFSLKDNQRNGEVIWYNDRGGIIQTGHFDNDKKTGEWNIINNQFHLIYHYHNDLLHGMWFNYFEDILFEYGTYTNGIKTGDGYQFDDQKRMMALVVYDGSCIDCPAKSTFFINGNKSSVRYPPTKDTVDILFSNTGKICYLSYFNPSHTIRYEEIISNDTLQYYSARTSNEPSTDFKDTLKQQFHRWFTKQISKNSTFLKEINYKNGRITSEYDFTTDTLPVKIIFSLPPYDEPAKFELIHFNKKDDIYIFKLSAFKVYSPAKSNQKIKYLSKEQVFLESGYPILTVNYDSLGRSDTILSPTFLNLTYPDHYGFKELKRNKKRRVLSRELYLLHTDFVARELFYLDKKGAVLPLTTFTIDSISGSNKIYITQREYSDDQKFCLIHQFSIQANPEKMFVTSPETLKGRSLNTIPLRPDFRFEYNGKPLNGTIDYSSATKRSKSNKIKLMKVTETGTFVSYVVGVNNLVNLNLVAGREYELTDQLITSHFTIDNGYLKFMSSNLFKGEIGYDNSALNGTFIGNPPNAIKAYYDHGVKQGTCKSSGELMEYDSGKLNGLYIKYDLHSEVKSPQGRRSFAVLHDQIEVKTYYTRDTLNGWFYKYHTPGKLKEKVYIDMGLPHGYYWYGGVVNDTSVWAKLNHGYLVDTALYFYSEGIVKCKVLYCQKDSVFFAGKNAFLRGFQSYKSTAKTGVLEPVYYRHLVGDLKSFDGNYQYLNKPFISFDPNNSGEYFYYYKNGVLASHGNVTNGFKTGTWEHFDLNGGRLKTITYDTGIYVNPNTGDTIDYYGKIEMWYPNGKPLLKGLITSQFEQFRCEREMNISLENLFYLSLFDENGKETFHNNNGWVYEFHNNGNRRLEGEIKDGKRDGLWKFYDPDGRLEEVGNYINGIKTGTWLAGDLEAVPHYYDRCMKGEISPPYFPDAESTGYITQPIHIVQYIYVNGNIINQQSFRLLPLYGDYYYIESNGYRY